jgi:hypothetical protein
MDDSHRLRHGVDPILGERKMFFAQKAKKILRGIPGWVEPCDEWLRGAWGESLRMEVLI